jgi:dipeptidyl aminopeptidase/acylaminoacyl peptidase
MRTRKLGFAAAIVVICAAVVYAQSKTAGTKSGYLTPPKVVVDILDAPPTPTVIVSPDHHTIAVLNRRSMPTIAELAQPIHRIAGARINPKTNGRQQRGGTVIAITLRSIADGTEKRITVPPNSNIGDVSFSSDGKRLSFTNTKDNGIELWVADTTTGQSRLLSGTDRINAAAGDPVDWLKDGDTLLVQLVPAGRGAAPTEPLVPTGPNIQENHGKAAPTPTFEDMIKTNHDEDLFEYYFTSQLAIIDAATGRKTLVGKPGILESVTPSPNGEYIIISRVKRPFSHLVPMNGFPKEVEIWTRRGDVAKKIADLPSSEGTPINGVETGPRNVRWRPDQPATVVWAEALDGGDLKNKVDFRDKVLSLAAPFTSAPVEIAKTEGRFSGISYTEKGIALLSEFDRPTRKTRTWILETGAEPRKLWDRRQQDGYTNPGTPVSKRDGGGGGGRGGFGGGGFGGGGGLILQNGDSILLIGVGSSTDGDRPFLDRLNLKTLKTERLFRCAEKTYENIIAPLDSEAKTILTE